MENLFVIFAILFGAKHQQLLLLFTQIIITGADNRSCTIVCYDLKTLLTWCMIHSDIVNLLIAQLHCTCDTERFGHESREIQATIKDLKDLLKQDKMALLLQIVFFF